MASIQTPGPVQGGILEALAIAMAGGSPDLTSMQLAETLDRPVTSILGALSGMGKLSNRRWVKQTQTSIQREDRRWGLTMNGMAAILKSARHKETS